MSGASQHPDQTAYGLLTEQHTLLVLDTETTPAADGGPQRVIQVGTVPVTLGRRGRTRAVLVDPREAITNTRIHGIRDVDVAGHPDFAATEPALTAQLRAPGVVLVAHYAAYDVNVLRGEYERLGLRMPDVPVLDTIALARYVKHDTGRSSALTALARSLDIAFVPEHDAGKDAAVTAKCLVALLRKAAAAGLVSLSDILTDVGATTAAMPAPQLRTRPEPEPEPSLPAGHLATHAQLLAAEPTAQDLEDWAAGALSCVQVRCPLARDRAAAAVQEAPQTALDLLTRLSQPAALTGLGAGQAGTHAALLEELFPAAYTGAVRALTWWRTMRPRLQALPRCEASGEASCADCREGRPCPLDTLHHAVATAACGDLSEESLNRSVGALLDSRRGGVTGWVKNGDLDVAGYAMWLIHDVLAERGARSRASSTLDHAVELGLHRVEPRLAVAHAQGLVLQGRLSDASAVIDGCPRPAGSTDDGYRALRDWAAGPYAEAVARIQPPRARVRTLPRQSRPDGRTRPNRLKF